MKYLIDFDTLTVLFKSEDNYIFEQYIEAEDLSLSVALIHNADELLVQFNIKEIDTVVEGLIDEQEFDRYSSKSWSDDNDRAESAWSILEDNQHQYPNFTKAAGKRSVKAHDGENKPTPTPRKPAPSKSTEGKPISRKNLPLEASVSLTVDKSRSGSVLHTVITAINDEMCDTVGEVLDYITSNHIIPKTGELADDGFARDYIRYFIKEGKLKLEEEEEL